MLNNEYNVDFIVAMLCPNMNRVSYNPVKPSASVMLAMTLMCKSILGTTIAVDE